MLYIYLAKVRTELERYNTAVVVTDDDYGLYRVESYLCGLGSLHHLRQHMHSTTPKRRVVEHSCSYR